MPFEIRKPGEMVEGFRVVSELGRGAASIIYLVQDPKTKQVWALKHVVKDNPKDQRFLDQALAEYQIASKLNHPRLRKITQVIKKGGLLTTNELYLVMEHVDGASMEFEQPATFEEATGILEQVAQGLAYMHKMGFVHADMKPNNIMINDALEAKIIDLGQSCTVGTVKERIQGTPDYIAPEQVHRRPITEKTDVYNLGATMYWIVTRRFVPTALAKSDSLVGSREDHLLERPRPTSEFNTRVPELLDKLIMECVEIDAAKRPATMDEVAERLNLIRGKLLAEGELRKSGMLPRIDPGPMSDPKPDPAADPSRPNGGNAAKPPQRPEAPGDHDDEAAEHGARKDRPRK